MSYAPLLSNLGINVSSEFGLLFNIGVIIIAAALIGLLAKYFKQPPVLGYILAGIVLGPSFLGIVSNQEVIKVFAELGVAFLLFIVGLELTLSKLKECGVTAIYAGLAEILLVFSVGFFIALGLGFGSLPSIYIGLILAFSSTAILVKLLGDKKELDTLHGRIILGILLIQDVAAVIALSILTTVGKFSIEFLSSALLKGIGLVALAVVLSQYVLPPLLKRIEDSSEMLFLVSLSFLFLFIGLTTKAGLSTAVGGFIAGISLSSFPYNMEIISRARSLRDFFVTIFFVSLGLMISFEGLSSLIVPFFLFLGLIIIFKPFIVGLMVSLQGYGSRTSILSGISLAQVSEFSLVLALTGLSLGHLSRDVFSLSALLMMVSIILTSYIIKYDRPISNKISLLFYGVDVKKSKKEKELEHVPEELENHIIVFGAHEKGRKTLEYLKKKGKKVIAVDYNPEVVRMLKRKGIPCIYGDAVHPEILDRLNLEKAELIISTIVDIENNLYLIKTAKKKNPKVLAFVTAEDLDSSLQLYDAGADYVLSPKTIASEALLSAVINAIHTKERLGRLRFSQIRELEHRKEEDILDRFGPAFLKHIKRRIAEKSWRKKNANKEGGGSGTVQKK